MPTTIADAAAALFGPSSTTIPRTDVPPRSTAPPDTTSPTSTAPPASTSSATASPSADSAPDGKAVASQPDQSTTPSSSSDEKTDERNDLAARHAAAARRLGNQVKELTAKLHEAMEKVRVLEAKASGEPPPSEPSPEDIAAREHFRGRELASRELAFQLYGEDAIKRRVYGILPDGKDVEGGGDFAHLVKEQPWIQWEVKEHPHPTIAAYRALLRQEWVDTYGDDPSQWEARVIEKVKPKLLEDLRRQLSMQPTGEAKPSITTVRGSGLATKPASIEDIFYGKKG